MPKSNIRSWNDFSTALHEHFGSPRRAQTNFSEKTNYGLSSLQHWRKSDRVPEEAFTALSLIDATKCSPTLFQGYHTQIFTKRVVELSAQKKTLSEIATILAAECGRTVNENMIKGIRYRNKSKIQDYQSRS